MRKRKLDSSKKSTRKIEKSGRELILTVIDNLNNFNYSSENYNTYKTSYEPEIKQVLSRITESEATLYI